MKLFILFPLLVIGITACDSNNRVTTTEPEPEPKKFERLEPLAAQDSSAEAGELVDDVAILQNDINAIFNSTIPVEVESGDSLQDVISRAKSF